MARDPEASGRLITGDRGSPVVAPLGATLRADAVLSGELAMTEKNTSDPAAEMQSRLRGVSTISPQEAGRSVPPDFIFAQV